MGSGGSAERPATRGSELNSIQSRLIYPMINEAAKCLESGIVSDAWAIDLAMVLGTGFAPFRGGPLRTADALGLTRIVHEMEELRDKLGNRFEPCSLLRSLVSDGRDFYTERAKATEREEIRR